MEKLRRGRVTKGEPDMTAARDQVIDTIRKLISEKVKQIEPGLTLFNVVTTMPFGSGAGNIITRVKTPSDCLRIAFNSQGSDLTRIRDSVDVVIPCGEPPYKGSAHDPEIGKQHIESVVDLMSEAINEICKGRGITEPDCIITIHSLGHGFGTGSLRPVIAKLKEDFPNTVLLPIAITPFSIEKTASERAYRAVEDASKLATVFVISNETAARRLAGDAEGEEGLEDILNLPKPEVYERINLVITGIINGLINSLTSTKPPLQSLDRSDLRSIVNGPLGVISWTPLSSCEELGPETINEAEKNEFLTLAGRERSRRETRVRGTYIVDAPGNISLGQEKMLSEYLENKYDADPAHIKPLQISRSEGGDGYLIIIKSGFVPGRNGKDICGYYSLPGQSSAVGRVSQPK